MDLPRPGSPDVRSRDPLEPGVPGAAGAPGAPVAPGGPGGEKALVERARAGDAAAFDVLVRTHYRAVYATAFHLAGNPEDAEDLAQESFVRAHGALSWFRADAPFAAWMRRIVVHLARDRFRASARRPTDHPLEADLFPASVALEPTEALRRRESVHLLTEAIQRLPVWLRIPLVLRALDGLEYAEIAAATGVTPATARTQVMKARRALAALFERRDRRERPEDGR